MGRLRDESEMHPCPLGRFELVTRRFELVARGFELALLNFNSFF